MTVRIGIVGAGNFTKRRLLPNLKALPDVEVVAVCNRSLESGQRVAKEFSIPNVETDWRALVSRPDIEAVFIGTQPYFHHQASIAAMDAGKHVLCQTRMATSLREAREMLQKAEQTGCKAMLVRSSFCARGRGYIKQLLDSGYVGPVRQVFGYGFVANYIDGGAPMHRRQDGSLYGVINPLSLGGVWDTFRDWFGDPRRLLTQARVFTDQREQRPGGPVIDINMPDSITVIAEMELGAVVTCVQSGVALFGEDRVEIFGEKGTLVYFPERDELLGGQLGDTDLSPMPVPSELVEGWHVEEGFVRLVRGEIDHASPSYLDGVKNIEFLEASHLSAIKGGWVDLPLP